MFCQTILFYSHYITPLNLTLQISEIYNYYFREMPSFAGIQEDCEQIINDIRHKLELRLEVNKSEKDFMIKF